MTTPTELGTQAIGAAGELLVQYQLLKRGIDSARLTTDSGIDLVMYVPGSQEAATVQVKARFGPAPAGGKGKLSVAFPFPHKCPAQWLACVDLSRDLVWLLRTDEARLKAQQHRTDGSRLLYWYVDETVTSGALVESQMAEYRLESVANQLLAKGDAE
ncbi:hypothetical protein [Mycobacterium sp. DL592]|uniref:hypothetical protein n=1 Tax=Mycobacterium sp. DL592 TaxID=2675524 RepID=UPI001423BE21|nr:hypothetical protein [Mycobacterium sp. DL592]